MGGVLGRLTMVNALERETLVGTVTSKVAILGRHRQNPVRQSRLE